eukprot:GFUD01036627.1.p1 GENE.GFUD01036627.1~~GFUD01036627.1.p1  ORF type:complete len:225 (+),score=71.12 GFUD01036627.1:215-889(+)
MLQNAIRKFLMRKFSKSEPEVTIVKDYQEFDPEINKTWEFIQQTKRKDCYDFEIVSRKHKSENFEVRYPRYRRKRVLSCPDSTDLRNLSKTLEFAILDLKKICEEGEQFLCDDDSNSSSKCDDSGSEGEVFEENVKKEVFYNKNRMSTVLLEDFSVTQTESMGRIAKSFESDLEKAVQIVLELPDNDQKMELLQDLIYRIEVLKKEATANCHLAIISTVMDDYG